MSDTDKLTLLRAGTLPKNAAEWVEGIIAERDRARNDVLEEAARECDMFPDEYWGLWLANRIRALKASK